ncbi:MAG: DUF4258 domain-containing protein [Verrucomicrobia bacterium]|nr:DUF4258 domain-containing protein [Verrucomicrobiota bacterium]
MRERVRAARYVVTSHARKEMNDDSLNTDDLERAIFTGAILERQKDRITAELKFRLQGEATDGRQVEVVAKISPTGKLVVITVYAL